MSDAAVFGTPASPAVRSPTPSARPATGPTAWGRLASWIRHATGWWRRRSLARSFAVARLALGERMFAAGIDDGETGERIAALDQAIRRVEAGGVVRQDLLAEREWLFRRLADAALEDDAPLPGADSEYARARKILASLREGDR